jgi:CheY-like chemotaxis protein
VDDRDGVRRVTVGILRKLGYTVFEAADSAEALVRSSGFRGTIDLLLTDLAMPGIQGTELARLLRRSRPGLRVIYMTGFHPAVAEGEEAGCADGLVLVKPFTADTLGQAVRKVLDEDSPVDGTSSMPSFPR